MSIVSNGRISSNDQRVDKKKHDSNYDEIDFSNAPWRKDGKVSRTKASRRK